MNKRQDSINIPIELIRALVAINDTGSFTKTATALGLTQPAITAQVKRLQTLVGGPVFEKGVGGGIALNGHGRLIMASARKMLDANDRMLSLAGGSNGVQPVRIGVSHWYVEAFAREYARLNERIPIHVYCDSSDHLSAGIASGYLDIGLFLDPTALTTQIVGWDEDFVWAKAPQLVLHPEAPIPLITWPGNFANRIAIHALEAKNLRYAVNFASPDYRACLLGAGFGIGILPIPARAVREPLVIAHNHFLPNLPTIRAAICARDQLDLTEFEPIITALRKSAPTEAPEQPSYSNRRVSR